MCRMDGGVGKRRKGEQAEQGEMEPGGRGGFADLDSDYERTRIKTQADSGDEVISFVLQCLG